MTTNESATPLARPRRTILAPLPDEDDIDRTAGPASAQLPEPVTHPTPVAGSQGRGRPAPPRGLPNPQRHEHAANRDEKPDSSTKAYLWRRNVRFIDTLVMDMEDHGARAGDINRSVVLRAAISALEHAGLARDLALCADENALTELITRRLTGAKS